MHLKCFKVFFCLKKNKKYHYNESVFNLMALERFTELKQAIIMNLKDDI